MVEPKKLTLPLSREDVAGCALRLPFDQYPADLTPRKLNTLINKNKKELKKNND